MLARVLSIQRHRDIYAKLPATPRDKCQRDGLPAEQPWSSHRAVCRWRNVCLCVSCLVNYVVRVHGVHDTNVYCFFNDVFVIFSFVSFFVCFCHTFCSLVLFIFILLATLSTAYHVFLIYACRSADDVSKRALQQRTLTIALLSFSVIGGCRAIISSTDQLLHHTKVY